MDEMLTQSTAGQTFNMLLLSIFALAALLLAGIGIYVLMAHSVRQRTQEVGLRLALGARSNDVRNMVVFQGTHLALAGIAVGMAGALSCARVMESFLWGVEAKDPIIFSTVPMLLGAVAFFAMSFPARRARSVDPVEALRHE